MHYCPVSIIISTYFSNLDFFRNLLLNIYKIIKFDYSILLSSNSNNNSNEKNSPNTNNSINSNIDNEKIKSFQKIELLNYLNFCYQLPRPPNKSIFTLITRLDTINYKFQSLAEIPTNDYCIDIANDKFTFRFNEAKYLNFFNERNKISVYCFIDMFDYTYNPGSYMDRDSTPHKLFVKKLKKSLMQLLNGENTRNFFIIIN